MRSLEFDRAGFEDLAWWVEQNRAQALRVIRLIREIQREPFSGMG
ncbi:MAG: type II toxin-antitoxin system YoeB family toxin, partial [Acidobacteriia bacterium]|nr:type II toxin-antitoxin system YoeB family toxin [Terriglobia bacterium]